MTGKGERRRETETGKREGKDREEEMRERERWIERERESRRGSEREGEVRNREPCKYQTELSIPEKCIGKYSFLWVGQRVGRGGRGGMQGKWGEG